MKRINLQHYFYLLVFLVTIGAFSSCKSQKETITRRLFLQSKRATVEFPPREDLLSGDPESFVLTEKVTYTHEDNESEILGEDAAAQEKSIEDIQQLDQVTVTAEYKRRFTPERDGHVQVDFIVKVPKEYLSDQWRLTMTPLLKHNNDSTITLEPLVLKGQSFQDKQNADIARWESYVGSIIDKGDYDDIFLDRAGIAHDLRKRQEYYYSLYHKQFRMIDKYLSWRLMMEERYAYANTVKETSRLDLYNRYMRKANEQAIKEWSVGRDSTGMGDKYAHKFDRTSNFWPKYKLHRELDVKTVPARYRLLYINDMMPGRLSNLTTTEKDSIEIARHRYLFGAIAENEMRDQRQEAKKREMVPFPMETDTRLTSVTTGERDFIYYYTQTYPVTPGLDRLQIMMEGKVEAIDKSTFTLPKMDTLSYFISSLAELADSSLTVKETKIFRNMVSRQTLQVKFAPNQTDFTIAYGDNRMQVDSLIRNYNRFTTDRGLYVDSVRLTASTALDGSYKNNMKLSAGRVKNFSEYLQKSHGHYFPEHKIKTYHIGEDWSTLAAHIRKRNDLQNKESILKMITGTVTDPDQTEQEIKNTYRSDYKIIHDQLYPLLGKIDVIWYLSRPGMVEAETTLREVKEGYGEGVRLLRERKYEEALAILERFEDYNTALCLACLGYNGKAYDILSRLEPTGNTEYLLAIIMKRLGMNWEAKDRLINALALDPAKSLRVMTDSETLDLVRQYHLQENVKDAETAWFFQPWDWDDELKEESL